jgi:hypothetical protein
VTLLYTGVNVSYLTILSPTEIALSNSVAVVSNLDIICIVINENTAIYVGLLQSQNNCIKFMKIS